MKVLVIGAGRFGKALGGVLEYNGNEVEYYDPIVFPEVKLETVLEKSEVVLFVAPSKTAKETVEKLPENLPLILASKGFWNDSKFQKFTDFSVLSGAAFAEDIVNEMPRFGSEIVLVGTSQLAEKLFSTEYLRVQFTRDVRGVLICGCLKNIFAIYMGAENPEDMEGKYRKIFHEMEDLLFENGADPGTVKLACGMADVILTCSEESRNFQFGKVLRDREKAKRFYEENTVEGVNAVMNEEFLDFRIPETARIFKKITEEIKNAIK